MKIIGRSRLEEFWEADPRARSWLQRWLALAEVAEWEHLQDVRATFTSADGVRVGKKVATVFDRGQTHRLIVAIDYEQQIVVVRWFLTHADYDRGWWKGKL